MRVCTSVLCILQGRAAERSCVGGSIGHRVKAVHAVFLVAMQLYVLGSTVSSTLVVKYCLQHSGRNEGFLLLSVFAVFVSHWLPACVPTWECLCNCGL